MSKRIHILLIMILFSAVVASSRILSTAFAYPFHPAKTSSLEQYAVLDLVSILSGARRLGADIAWIQLLQYYGTPEKPLDRETEYRVSWDMTRYLLGMPVEKEVCHESGCADADHYHPQIEGGVYPQFLSYCQRVLDMDPFFYYAYLYGAGALAWNLNRPDEAIELVERGIAAMGKYHDYAPGDAHQPLWQLNLYLSAIIYRKTDQFEKMSSLLETAVKQPGCPNLVKAILANIHQKEKKLVPSLKLWMEIYDSNDPSYRARAEEKILELRKYLNI